MSRYWLPYKVYFVGKLAYFSGNIPAHGMTVQGLLGGASLLEGELLHFAADLRDLAKQGCFDLKAKIPRSYIESELNKIRAGMVGGVGSAYRKPDPYLGLGSAFKKAASNEYLSDEEIVSLLASKKYGAINHCTFLLQNLNPKIAKELLDEYLELYRGDALSTGGAESVDGSTAHFLQLEQAVRRLMANNYKPVIKFTDIWISEYDRTPGARRFWETILYAKSVGNVEILEMGYDGQYRSSHKVDGRIHSWPYALAYAKVAPSSKMQAHMHPLTATAPKTQQSSESSAAGSQIETTARLKLISMKLLLEINGNRYLIKPFSRKGSAQYNACQELLSQHGQQLTNEQAGIGNKTSWTDLLKNVRLTGALSKHFVVRRKSTIALLKSATITQVEASELVDGLSRL